MVSSILLYWYQVRETERDRETTNGAHTMAIYRMEYSKGEMVDGKYVSKELGFQESYAGCVIEVYQRDYRAMSDVYTYATFALVWDDTENRPVEILVNANFECDHSKGHAKVDLTPLHQSKYLLWQHKKKEEEKKYQEAKNLEYAKKDFSNGKTIKVVKGRKVKVGTQGRVFWMGNNGWGLTLGIALSDRKGTVVRNGRTYNNSYLDTAFVPAANCEVILDQSQG